MELSTSAQLQTITGENRIMEKQAREMTDAERALLGRFLQNPFPGSEAVAEQLHNSLVLPIDDNGSLDFLIQAGPKAEIHSPVPVEAEAEDPDGTTIHMLLHVIDGTTGSVQGRLFTSNKMAHTIRTANFQSTLNPEFAEVERLSFLFLCLPFSLQSLS